MRGLAGCRSPPSALSLWCREPPADAEAGGGRAAGRAGERAALTARKATGGEAAGKRPPARCRSHRLSRPHAWRAPRLSHRAAHPRSRAGGTVKTVTALTFELIQTRRAARPLPGLRRAVSRCPPILSPPSSLPTLHVRRRRVSSLCGPVCAGPVPALVKGEPGHRRREAGPAGGRAGGGHGEARAPRAAREQRTLPPASATPPHVGSGLPPLAPPTVAPDWRGGLCPRPSNRGGAQRSPMSAMPIGPPRLALGPGG